MPQPERWTDTDIGCDHCGKAGSAWSEGLMCIDREDGTFTCDFIACPDCTPETTGVDGLATMLRQGVTFTRIDWFWFAKEAQHALVPAR
jgi:hypothetical protein